MTALCAFTELNRLIATARVLRDVESIAALEVVDGRAIALAAERLGADAPVHGDWVLLVELAAGTEQTARLADLLDGLNRNRPSGWTLPPATGCGKYENPSPRWSRCSGHH